MLGIVLVKYSKTNTGKLVTGKTQVGPSTQPVCPEGMIFLSATLEHPRGENTFLIGVPQGLESLWLHLTLGMNHLQVPQELEARDLEGYCPLHPIPLLVLCWLCRLSPGFFAFSCPLWMLRQMLFHLLTCPF